MPEPREREVEGGLGAGVDRHLRGCGIEGVRQDVPPKMESISYEIIVDTDEVDRRLELLHDNVKKYGTVFNTVAPGTQLTGVMRRKVEPGSSDGCDQVT